MPRPLDLSSSVSKINRASEHLSTLSNEIGDFVKNDLYEVRTESYRRSRERRQYSRREIEDLGLRGAFRFRQINDDILELGHGVDYQRALVTLKKRVPPHRCAVLIGDVIQNLRSALDNLVWALSDANHGPAPYPVLHGSKWKQVRMPLVMDSKNWQSTAKNNLWGLRPSQQVGIEKSQPFYRREPKNRSRHWLYVLDELWNADKHRSIHIVSEYGGLLWLRITPEELDNIMEVKVIRARDRGPLEYDTEEVARYRIAPRQGRLYRKRQADMKVHVGLSFEVAFGEQTPIPGANVLETLMGLSNRVVATLLNVKPDFTEPLPVWFTEGETHAVVRQAG